LISSLRGLAVLWRAYIWADHTGANVTSLGNSLYQTGMTAGDLRWLITKGLAEHRRGTSYEALVVRSAVAMATSSASLRVWF
jgi:hypothetical protein